MNIDDEIKQDFLIEAGELYDLLNDQLTELESDPEDSDLLNALFRAFHTIKGGAGFLELVPMVEVCHRAEDVFDMLRKGEVKVDSALIDVFYQVLDVLGDMFENIRQNESQQSADISLLNKLDGYLNTGVSDESGTHTNDDANDSSNDKEAVMSNADESEKTVQTDAECNHISDASSPDLITDDEFDDLLDEIHGKGKHSMVHDKDVANDPVVKDVGDTESQDLPLETVSKDKSVATKDSVKKETKKTETSVRVDTERLDDIMNLVGELVLVRNRLSMLKQDMKQDHVSDAITTLELLTTDLQASVMKTRMQPIKKVFNRFPRLIRDLAKKLNKDIILQLVGEDTDLDKSLVEALADPLIHLVRNSADHGIESPEDRYAAGKDRQGTITLSAKQEGDQILLTVSDDGKGMNPDVFRRKAIESGMLTEDAVNNMSDKEAFNLIFAPGFSTKSEVSDVSGRGVGMDVVKTRINELNGNVEIDSKPGEGSVITIALPLTLAILPTLMVKLHTYQFALPLNNVYEAFNMEPDNINVVDNQEVIRVRGETLPIFYLYPWLIRNNDFDGPKVEQKILVVQMGSLRFCLVVDQIVGQEEVVIKPLGTMLESTAGFSGATITGDGNIALVLDMPSLMNKYTENRAVY